MMQLLKKSADIIRFTSDLQVLGIDALHLIVDDSSATKILSNPSVNGIHAVVTLPGIKLEGVNIDALHSKNSIIIWVLTKGDKHTNTQLIDTTTYLDLLQLMDQTIEKYRDAMHQSSQGRCSLLAGLDVEQIVVTPEYNTFGGWNGWCASIAMK